MTPSPPESGRRSGSPREASSAGLLRSSESRLAAALALVVLLVRVWAAHSLRFCGTPDACSYLGLGQSLASGQGFHTRFLFDYQLAHPALPNTGIEYWRPGISLLLMLLKPFGGLSLHSSVALTALVGVLFAAAAWHIARHSGYGRRLALFSFALALLLPTGWNGSLTPDSGLYYGAAVAWFLALFTIRRQGLVQDLLALACIGAAYLIRNDAALLLFPLLAVLWQRHRLAASVSTQGSSFSYAALLLAGFVLALAPMHLLYRAVLGTAFPSGTAQAFFLNDLSDFERYGSPVTLHTLLATGWKHLVLYRVGIFATLVYRMAALMLGYPALVFLPGLFARRPPTSATLPSGAPGIDAPEHAFFPEFTGPAVFLVTLLLVYGFVVPVVGQFSALRSAVGLLPLAAVLVILAVTRVARSAQLAVALTVALLVSYALDGFMADRRDVAAMNAIGAADRTRAEALRSLGADPAHAIILTPDPVQFAVTTGFATAALPSNGLDAIAHAAQDLHATHVILDTEDLPASSQDVYSRLHTVRARTLSAEHTVIFTLPPSPAP